MRHVFTYRVAAVLLVSESGLYKLITRSDNPEARKLQDWVTREVLPSIRKTGTYTMPGQGAVIGDEKVGATVNEAERRVEYKAPENSREVAALFPDPPQGGVVRPLPLEYAFHGDNQRSKPRIRVRALQAHHTGSNGGP